VRTLLDVLQALFEQLDDVIVVEGVEDLTAVAARADEAHAAQEAQLMRDGGLRQPEDAREVLDAELRSGQHVEDPDAGLVAEDLEGFGERRHRRLAEQRRRGPAVDI